MFSLEKELHKWRTDFTDNEDFTEEDIQELESHLLDKISELEKQGLSQAEAYSKALNELGFVNELEGEYKKANLKNKIISKVIVGIWGYAIINLILNSVALFIGLTSIFMKNNDMMFWGLEIPLINELAKMFGASDYPSGLQQIIVIVCIILSVILMYITLFNKKDYIERVIDNINNLYKKGTLSKVMIAISPIILIAISQFIFKVINYKFGIEIYINNLYIYGIITMVYSSLLVLGTLIKFKEISKRPIVGDFIIGFIAITIIPYIVNVINLILYNYTSFLGGGRVYIISLILYTLLTVLGVKLISKNNYETIKFNLLLILGLCFITCYFMFPVLTKIMTLAEYGQVSYVTNILNSLVFLLLQILIGFVTTRKPTSYLNVK